VHQLLSNNIATAALSEQFPVIWIVTGRPTSYIPGFNVLEFPPSGYTHTKKAWFMGLLQKKS
jgi:hypothetical protein